VTGHWVQLTLGPTDESKFAAAVETVYLYITESILHFVDKEAHIRDADIQNMLTKEEREINSTALNQSDMKQSIVTMSPKEAVEHAVDVIFTELSKLHAVERIATTISLGPHPSSYISYFTKMLSWY
jgi:hypothetical protein